MQRSTLSPALPEDAAARSGTYRLLARLWLREVNRDFLRLLLTPPLRDSFIAVGGILPAADDDATIEQLAIDYCQLLVGPANHLPPYQSVWQSGQFQGATTHSMQRFIDVTGYDTGALTSGIMLDHLGVQLDVMGHIVSQISTWPDTPESLTHALDVARSFFTTHLMWPNDLLNVAAQQATTGFYRSTILLTRDYLMSELHA